MVSVSDQSYSWRSFVYVKSIWAFFLASFAILAFNVLLAYICLDSLSSRLFCCLLPFLKFFSVTVKMTCTVCCTGVLAKSTYAVEKNRLESLSLVKAVPYYRQFCVAKMGFMLLLWSSPFKRNLKIMITDRVSLRSSRPPIQMDGHYLS